MMRELHSWVQIAEDSDFSIYNLPFGIFSQKDQPKRVGVAIGKKVVDLSVALEIGLFDSLEPQLPPSAFQNEFLNDFISLGKRTTNAVRKHLQNALCDPSSTLKNHPEALLEVKEIELHMPVKIGDYTDFYSSIEHATNVGKMFRDPANALLPNWRHIPVGYHGRASSIVISGENVRRPFGQIKPQDENPVHIPTQRLDFELEMAFVIGKKTSLGRKISVETAEEYIFGLTLFNDWSARDVQKWEYVPLGPFLAKNFASSMSPWIVTLEALEDFRVQGPAQDPPVLPYLRTEGLKNFDINLSVELEPENGSAQKICQSNFKYMYWNMAQQLAHHTMNGCNINVGDVMASGTISGPEAGSFGSMLELAWGGKNPIKLNDGTTRTFLNDGDTVTMKGYAEKESFRVGFGEVKSKILPATDEF